VIARLGVAFGVAVAAVVARPAGSAALTAQQDDRARVTVVAIDRALGTPVRAMVTSAGGDSARSTVAAQGATLSLTPGRHTITVRALGYLPVRRAVDVAAGSTAMLRVELDATALPLDAVVITASRREQRLADTPVITEVVTARDIAATGAADLASALVEQTGIQLQGGIPSGAGVMLQGIGSERVLVLVDGQPLTGRIGGLLDLSRLPTAAVDRVEIVKGPQSTLYGSEAMGGVINVVMRRPSGAHFAPRLMMRAGTQRRIDANGGADFSAGPFATSVDVGRRTVETTAGRSDVPGSMTASLDGTASLRWLVSPTSTMGATVLATDERQRWRTGGLYQIGDNLHLVARLRGETDIAGARIVPTLGYSVLDHVLYGSTQPAPIRGDTGQRQVQRLAVAGVTGSVPLGSGAHRLDAGVEAKHEAIRAARVVGDRRSITSLEPFSQLEITATPRLTVVPGVRLSWNEVWGTHVTPRLAARAELATGMTARVSIASGFRAPDFKELYLSFQNEAAQYAVQGNPALRPERSRNVTGSLDWVTTRGYLRGQFFHNDLHDFIETRVQSAPGEPLLFKYENVGRGFTRGVESEGAVVLSRLRLEAGYSVLGTRDGSTGRELLGRPRQSGRLTANVATRFARLSVTQLATGRTPMTRDDESGAITGWRNAFTRTDLRITLPTWRGGELSAGIDNVLDARPAMWAAPTARHVYFTLSWAPRIAGQ
jgi:outer membrane receptor for ferrienterochelin and colicins